MRDHAFISYSHKDQPWHDILITHLKPLQRLELIKAWSDTQIEPGDQWRDEINQALATTKVAILLVSPNFLASDFIMDKELPALAEAYKKGEVRLVWILVSACNYKYIKDISEYQSANKTSQPLDSLSGAELNRVMVEVSSVIEKAFRAGSPTPAKSSASAPTASAPKSEPTTDAASDSASTPIVKTKAKGVQIQQKDFSAIIATIQGSVNKEILEAIFSRVFFSTPLIHQIDFSGVYGAVVVNLVQRLVQFGELEADYHSVCALLDAIKDEVGPNKKHDISTLQAKIGCGADANES